MPRYRYDNLAQGRSSRDPVRWCSRVATILLEEGLERGGQLGSVRRSGRERLWKQPNPARPGRAARTPELDLAGLERQRERVRQTAAGGRNIDGAREDRAHL